MRREPERKRCEFRWYTAAACCTTALSMRLADKWLSQDMVCTYLAARRKWRKA